MANLQYNFMQPPGNSFGHQFNEIIKFLKFLESMPKIGDHITLNLERINFVCPVFILSIASLAENIFQKGFSYSCIYPKAVNCAAYIKNIYFPVGLKPQKENNWEDLLNAYKGKNYLPIIIFPTRKSKITESLLSKINSLIKENFKLTENYESVVSYLLSEITDNIIEHSGKDCGWLMVQYYPALETLDICILDTGKSILGSYKDHDFKEALNDSIAVEMALKGLSTKSKERGTGLRTSKAISILGLQGDFALFSGKALFYRNQILNLPVSWSGTFVAMRIKKDIENFSLYTYV